MGCLRSCERAIDCRRWLRSWRGLWTRQRPLAILQRLCGTVRVTSGGDGEEDELQYNQQVISQNENQVEVEVEAQFRIETRKATRMECLVLATVRDGGWDGHPTRYSYWKRFAVVMRSWACAHLVFTSQGSAAWPMAPTSKLFHCDRLFPPPLLLSNFCSTYSSLNWNHLREHDNSSSSLMFHLGRLRIFMLETSFLHQALLTSDHSSGSVEMLPAAKLRDSVLGLRVLLSIYPVICYLRSFCAPASSPSLIYEPHVQRTKSTSSCLFNGLKYSDL